MPPTNQPLPPLTPTQKHLLDIVPIQQQAHIQTLFRSMSRTLGNGVVAPTKRERLRFWSAWQTWLAFNFPAVHPNLQQISRSGQIELLAAFAHHVRSGGISNRAHQVCTQTVQVTLRAISTKIQLDGQQSPVVGSQGKYPKKISELLESY